MWLIKYVAFVTTSPDPLFAHKVANRWFHNRTLIIGDAAHVFPPFGGQGIAAGLRDALALSWRLRLLLKLPGAPASRLLHGWQNEQRQRVDEAARMTMRNASLTVERSWLRAWLARLVMHVVALVPGLHGWVSRQRLRDAAVLKRCEDGFFVAARGGGARVSQIWVRPYCGDPVLSDEVFFRRAGSLAVVVLLNGQKQLEKEVEEVEGLLGRAAVEEELVSMSAVTFLMRTGRRRLAVERKDAERHGVYLPCPKDELIRAGVEPIEGYDERSFERRLGSKAKYVIVRPDCFVHSVADTAEEFLKNLSHVQEALSR
ncbi:hypothetical protein M1819_002500 [Neofusicoccum parvum]|nr:hypothetical protein M1819_002500 [Neofusicoccum parvum]